jgi:hypothetical protein
LTRCRFKIAVAFMSNWGSAKLEQLRSELCAGDGVTQRRLDEVLKDVAGARDMFRPRPGPEDELLPLFDVHGEPTGVLAPRWLCHLLGLRHRCIHVLLVCRIPPMGSFLLLQIRASKQDSPGRWDMTSTGHFKQSKHSELFEETGLAVSDLVNRKLHRVKEYLYPDSRPNEHFYNFEWRDVYVGFLSPQKLGRVRLSDGEVAGFVLVPVGAVKSMSQCKGIATASALREALPDCLDFLDRRIPAPQDSDCG